MSDDGTTSPRGWPALRRRAAGSLTVWLGLVGLASGLGLLARSWWPLELFAHFRVQYLGLSVLLAIGLAALGRLRTAGLAVGLAGFHLLWVAPAWLAERPAPGGVQLRLVEINLNSQNTDHARVAAFIRSEDPDLVLLLEVNERWLTALESVARGYPHRIARPRGDNFGIALWTRLPVDRLEIARIGSGLPSAVARLLTPQGCLTLLGTHPPPPAGASLAAERDQQIEAVARKLSASEGERVLLGDLNLTSWSPVFDDLIADSGLRDTRTGFGLQATWPTWFWPLSIPIDHCLISAGLRVVDRRVGPEIGSDHRPIVIELRFAGEAAIKTRLHESD